jgi:apolipoprotein N-acyltransferase
MDHYDQPEYMATMQGLCQETGAWLFMGTGREENGRNYNSSIVMDSMGNVEDHYDKVHLVPFGEYIPYENMLPFLKQIVPGGGVYPGTVQKVLTAGEHTLGPLICFEVLYPQMSQKLREMGANVLVVVTNLAWFGRSNAIVEELEFGRLRAVENRLPLIHSSNTGVSGVFDPYGRFTPVNAYLWRGKFVTLDDRELSFEQMTQQRMLGALSVPAPGTLPWSGGPVFVPVFLLFGAIMGTVLIFLMSPLRDNDGEGDDGDTGEPQSDGGPLQDVSAEETPGKSLRGVRIDGDY